MDWFKETAENSPATSEKMKQSGDNQRAQLLNVYNLLLIRNKEFLDLPRSNKDKMDFLKKAGFTGKHLTLLMEIWHTSFPNSVMHPPKPSVKKTPDVAHVGATKTNTLVIPTPETSSTTPERSTTN